MLGVQKDLFAIAIDSFLNSPTLGNKQIFRITFICFDYFIVYRKLKTIFLNLGSNVFYFAGHNFYTARLCVHSLKTQYLFPAVLKNKLKAINVEACKPSPKMGILL